MAEKMVVTLENSHEFYQGLTLVKGRDASPNQPNNNFVVDQETVIQDFSISSKSANFSFDSRHPYDDISHWVKKICYLEAGFRKFDFFIQKALPNKLDLPRWILLKFSV